MTLIGRQLYPSNLLKMALICHHVYTHNLSKTLFHGISRHYDGDSRCRLGASGESLFWFSADVSTKPGLKSELFLRQPNMMKLSNTR